MRMKTRRSTSTDGITAHTITQRIRQLKRMPPELIPLFVVILYVSDEVELGQELMMILRFAVGAAVFALGRKLVTDKTLRLTKSKPSRTAESH